MPEAFALHRFDHADALAEGLATRVAAQLREALDARGKALLAVSGGSTPKRFFEQLSQMPLDWARVTVTLVDERWVPESNERSNARLVKVTLLQHQAAEANFVPLYVAAPTPEAAIATLRARLGELPSTFDVVILGMGGDGHTASFFPGGDRLAEALDLKGTARVLPMRAEGAGEPRITFTLPALLDSRALFLHIEGEAKRSVFDTACEPGSTLPMGAVLRAAPQLEPWWCP
ncbi:6-phosphogluconolactonase [Dyella sp. A6]|uniref:6-phosphogluconolactonase n=1 Tax=Dyella aluminiiresistens TaxID=3069105 RepID=UPI002E76BA7D|nr:6-phosphogluconolactonase [Dyella sp. A6]